MSGEPTRRTARWIALTAFLVYALGGGGRIVGSDEVSMYQLARSMLRGRIDVPAGATLAGRDGHAYTKNAAAQAVLALPLVAAGEAAARVLPLAPARRPLLARVPASLFNAIVSAILLAAFFRLARALGLGPGTALAATLLLGFTTPLWVYAKSFMAEPLQGLGLLLALGGAARAGAGEERAGRTAALGVLLAVSAKLSMLPLALACLVPLGRRPGRWALPLAGLGAALAGHLAYNLARFGAPLETGYGSQATLAAYSTPLLVGLYGLLFSSGKGLMWFAPALWLAPAGFGAMRWAGSGGGAQNAAAAGAARGIAAAWLVGFTLYGTFQHWAGDGSYGPRYLVPLLPLGLLAVAFAPYQATRARRLLAWALALAGLFVQVGGVTIYFGAQMREAGDYPYTRPLGDPRFMSESHFNPWFNPVVASWRMLARNAGEHLRGEFPRLGGGGEADARLGVPAAEVPGLLHGLDFWWAYAGYAGVSPAAILALVAALLAACAWSVVRLRAALVAEARGP